MKHTCFCVKNNVDKVYFFYDFQKIISILHQFIVIINYCCIYQIYESFNLSLVVWPSWQTTI